MNVNAWVGFAVLVASFLFVAGRRAASHVRSRGVLIVVTGVGALLCVPALLLAGHYAHLFDNAAWYYRLRSIPGVESLSGGAGFLAGIVSGRMRSIRYPAAFRLFGLSLPALVTLGFAGLVVVPFAKPLLLPLVFPLHDEWRDGVCIQSSPSTCGPASVATLLRHFGIDGTEAELARESFSCATGTENWYLARALRRRGMNVRCVVTAPQPDDLMYPAIAGTDLGGKGGAGHFVAVLGEEEDRYVIGDPLSGRFLLTLDELKRRYYLTGFFLVVRPEDATRYQVRDRSR